MKNEKRAQAQRLFFQTNLSKSEIAAMLSVSRRTIHVWSREGDWERLRLSARHLPSLIAEQCYYVLAHLTRRILSEGREGIPVTLHEAEAMHKVALTIKKLKNRNTVNESMEMLTFFLDGLEKEDPALADRLKPHINKHITHRRDVYISDFLLDGFNHQLYLPIQTKDIAEQKLDEQADEELAQEWEKGNENNPTGNKL